MALSVHPEDSKLARIYCVVLLTSLYRHVGDRFRAQVIRLSLTLRSFLLADCPEYMKLPESKDESL